LRLIFSGFRLGHALILCFIRQIGSRYGHSVKMPR
jgi:hypothetical protein